jgi:hypothetical protein
VNPSAPGLIFIQIYRLGDNPLKYTDPDGNELWIPILLIGAISLSIASDKPSQNPNASISAERVNNILPNLQYGNPNIGPVFKRQYQTESQTSILLESNPLEAIGGGLPAGMPGPNDYDDGKTSKIGTILDSIGLAGSTIGNIADENGNFSGDFKMNIYSIDGKTAGWDITETAATVHAGPITSTLDKTQAQDYLRKNNQYLKDSGIYAKINNALKE